MGEKDDLCLSLLHYLSQEIARAYSGVLVEERKSHNLDSVDKQATGFGNSLDVGENMK